jgi:dephospho-CoA kinase
MLRVVVVGQSGAGRTTVCRRLSEHGAVVVADDCVDTEGPQRAAVSSKAAAVVVQDGAAYTGVGIPTAFHLVVLVEAPEPERKARVANRAGLSPVVLSPKAPGLVRQSASALDGLADVVLDNSRSMDCLLASVDTLWSNRIVPYSSNLMQNHMALYGAPMLMPPSPDWQAKAARLSAKVRSAVGKRALSVDHIGSTAIPNLPAKAVIDLQLTVSSLNGGDYLSAALRDIGFLRHPTIDSNVAHGPIIDAQQWKKFYFKSADPGCKANLHVRPHGTAGWRFALLFRDWLRQDPQIREEYLSLKRRLTAQHCQDTDTSQYALAKDPWFACAFPRMEEWALRSGWISPAPPRCSGHGA